MKRSLPLFVVSLSFALASCAGYTKLAMHVASLDHACDIERISILEKEGTTVVLDVCGRRRVYRDTAGANNPATWMDVTTSTEDCPATTPPVTPRVEPTNSAPDATVPAPLPLPAPLVDAGIPAPVDAGAAVDASVAAPVADGGVAADAATPEEEDEEPLGVSTAPVDAGTRARPRRRTPPR